MTVLGGPLIGLDTLMTQQAVIQRDEAVKDSLGATRSRDWVTIATLPCFMWWGTGAVITRMGSIQQRPEATVDLDTGGILLPAGTDVTARDQIIQVLDSNGDQLAGKLEVLAVAAFEPVTEISFRRLS